MKSFFGITLISFVLFFTACTDEPKGANAVISELRQADSVDIVYYDVPGNNANFKFTSLADSSLIQTLVDDISRESITGKECLKDGKIYCYKKGNVFNTIYFSFNDEGCRQLSYIHNAALHVFPMSNELHKSLRQHKMNARPPITRDTVFQKQK
jgi:hypothetical protein